MTGQPGLKARQFDDRLFALGLAVNYLMAKPAFARLPFGHWSRILAGQINRGHYFFVVENEEVVGFAGWALAGAKDAELWLQGLSDPGTEGGLTGDCLILNAWDASTPEANRFMLDGMRRIGAGKEAIYAKREYPDGRSRPMKLSVNDFVAEHIASADRTRGAQPAIPADSPAATHPEKEHGNG